MTYSKVIRVMLLVSVTGASTLWAYEIQTHELISKNALLSSVLVTDPQKLKQLGLVFPVGVDRFIQGFPDSKGDPRNIQALVTNGAVFEDQPAARVSNHFFNPINGKPLTVTLFGAVGATSPDWAIQGTGLGGWSNEFSYSKARSYFYGALTAPGKTERDRNFGLTFESLGHMVHHLQDMAQPQHVRSDQHLELDKGTEQDLSYVCYLGNLGLSVCTAYVVTKNPSRYEEYTNRPEVRGQLPFGGYAAAYSPEEPTNFSTPRQFWTNGAKGIAEYTNRGFVSAGTNFRGTPTSILPAPGLPKPDAAGAQVIKTAANDPTLFGAGTLRKGEMWFISTPVDDQLRSATNATNRRTSTFSIYDQDLIEKNQGPVFTLNRFNFASAYDFLIPAPSATPPASSTISSAARSRSRPQMNRFTASSITARFTKLTLWAASSDLTRSNSSSGTRHPAAKP